MSADKALDERVKDVLFRQARSYSYWQDRPVADEMLHEIYELAKNGPTSANSCPMRLVFVSTPDGKERLRPLMADGNVDKTMSAPVTAIIARDMRFYEHMDQLNPRANARGWFEGREKAIEVNSLMNMSLQGAYVMLAARSLGLDCGPMSGFKAKAVAAEFFPDADVVVNMMCNLGYGRDEKLHDRLPRFSFDEVAKIV